jgi:hypothetical protein
VTSLFRLDEQLTAHHALPGEAKSVNYPITEFALQDTLRAALVDKYDVPVDFRLDKMHEQFTSAQLAERFGQSGHWGDPLHQLGELLVSEYHKFVGWLSGHLGFDFVFENDPLVRYHVPLRLNDRYRLGNGKLFTHHSDTMLGDYFQQINCWLPFCDVKNTSALSMCSKELSTAVLKSFVDHHDYAYEGFKESRDAFFEYMKDRPALATEVHDDTMAINLRYGQLLMFNPRILHGTAENTENITRVSMDFRIIPLADYLAINTELEGSGTQPNRYEDDRLIMGEFYHSRTARQVAGQ